MISHAPFLRIIVSRNESGNDGNINLNKNLSLIEDKPPKKEIR